MAKQLTITIETRSSWIVQVAHPARAWCAHCSAEVDVISVPGPEVAAVLDPAVHRSEEPDGSTVICLPSLLARAKHPPRGDARPSLPVEKERT